MGIFKKTSTIISAAYIGVIILGTVILFADSKVTLAKGGGETRPPNLYYTLSLDFELPEFKAIVVNSKNSVKIVSGETNKFEIEFRSEQDIKTPEEGPEKPENFCEVRNDTLYISSYEGELHNNGIVVSAVDVSSIEIQESPSVNISAISNAETIKIYAYNSRMNLRDLTDIGTIDFNINKSRFEINGIKADKINLSLDNESRMDARNITADTLNSKLFYGSQIDMNYSYITKIDIEADKSSIYTINKKKTEN